MDGRSFLLILLFVFVAAIIVVIALGAWWLKLKRGAASAQAAARLGLNFSPARNCGLACAIQHRMPAYLFAD